MRPKENGVFLLEMFSHPPKPYKLWGADLWYCTECGCEVVMGYSMRAWEHFEPGFAETLEAIEARGDTLIHEYERS